MPPKKKKAAVTTLVGEYDVELMTVKELRMYVKALQEEHERMRKARNVNLKDKYELLNFLNFIQDGQTENKKAKLQKNNELQEEMLDQDLKLKFEAELLKAMEVENLNQVEKDTFESYINLITTKIYNKEKEHELLKDINEKDREIEHLEYIYQLIAIQSKENYFEEFKEKGKIFKNSFENLVTENHVDFLETCENFSKNKIENLQAIFGEIPTEECNSFSDKIAEMTDYFKDIYWKNMKTIENLQSVLEDLKQYLKYIISKLRDGKKENYELSYNNELHSPRESLITDPTFSPRKIKKFKDLTCENHLLNIKLKMLQKEYFDLKQQFVSAVRTIDQTADFKAFMLEKKLAALQSYPRRFG